MPKKNRTPLNENPRGSINNRDNGEIKIAQKVINNQLRKYMHTVSDTVKRSSLLTNGGNCNGWSFLYQYYLSKHAEFEFFEILRLIALWDGEKRSLNQSLKHYSWVSKHIKKKYKTLAELFEYTINDVLWFQHSGKLRKKLNSPITQKGRNRQWEIIHDDDLSFKTLFENKKLQRTISKEDLVKLLESCANCKDSWLDIGYKREGMRAGHAISVYMNDEGKFKYFNPNNAYNLKTAISAKQVAQYIFGNKPSIQLRTFNMHRFSQFNLPARPNNVTQRNPNNNFKIGLSAALFIGSLAAGILSNVIVLYIVAGLSFAAMFKLWWSKPANNLQAAQTNNPRRSANKAQQNILRILQSMPHHRQNRAYTPLQTVQREADYRARPRVHGETRTARISVR